MRTSVAAAAIAAGLLVIGCTQFAGGERQTEDREIDDATKVAVSSGIAVIVHIGEPASATLSAQEDVLPLIRVETVDGTLTIESTGSFLSTERVEVTVTISDIEELTASGGSAVELVDVALDQLTVDVSGGSRVTGGTSVSSLDITASGGARADLDGLTAGTIQVDASGGAVTNLRASGSVTGSASGGARVTVKGGATVAVDSSGGASVESE